MTEERSGQSPRNTHVVETRQWGEKQIPVVRKLAEEEIEAFLLWEHAPYVPKARETEEGFHICGSNQTANILQLETLDGIPIRELEQSQLYPGRESQEGLLANGESFLQWLAFDNHKVLSIKKPDGTPLSHNDLLSVVIEMQAAEYYAKQAPFIYNPRGRDLWLTMSGSLSGGISRWPEGITTGGSNYKAVNLESGAYVNFYSATPATLAYGFYQGSTLYRREPIELAETSGVLSIAEDDPIVQHVKNPHQKHILTNANQLKRLQHLYSVMEGTLPLDSIEIRCLDTTTYLTALSIAREADNTRWHYQQMIKSDNSLRLQGHDTLPLEEPRYIPKEIILKKLDISELIPSILKIGSREGYSLGYIDPNLLVHGIPALGDEDQAIINTVLTNIKGIEFPLDGLENINDFAQGIINAYKNLLEDARPIKRTTTEQAILKVRKVLGIPSRDPRDDLKRKAQEKKKLRGDYYQDLLRKVLNKEELRAALDTIKASYVVQDARGAKEELEAFIDHVIEG